jgi:hypothetical protein
VIGAVIIVVGLYCLIWGKSKDHLGNGKPGAAAVAELPLTSAPTANGNNGYGKHAALSGHHVAAGVETPPPSSVSKCVH